MSNCISCPSCGVLLNININQHKIFYFEPFDYDPKEEKYYAPRGSFKVKKEAYKERVDFLFRSWAKKIIIYDENKTKVETLWK